MELIIGVLVAFFAGGAAGYVLRATRDEAPAGGGRAAKPGRERDRAPAAARRGAAAPDAVTRFRPEPARPPVPLGDRAGPRRSGQATVLVADDRVELVALHSTHLERHGYRVLTATDGEAALALARKEHPAVVVLDHTMPGRSGLDVTRALKADPATADIVVLLMTAHSYGAIGASAREAGIASFMHKPCDPNRVLREVAAYAGPAN